MAAFVLFRLGQPLLHASAVHLDAGAVAFLGPAGRGKSTMAASFLSRGARLLADDLLPLRVTADGILAAPGLPIVKAWESTITRTLGLTPGHLPNVYTMVEKKLLWLDERFPRACTAAPLRALYVLARREAAADDTNEVTIRPLSGSAGLAAIVSQIPHGAFLTQAELGQFLSTVARLVRQAPVRVVSYPSAYDAQGAVCEAIMRDVERG